MPPNGSGDSLWRSQRRSWSQPAHLALAGHSFCGCTAVVEPQPPACPVRALLVTAPKSGCWTAHHQQGYSHVSPPCRWAPTCLCPLWVATVSVLRRCQGCMCCQGWNFVHPHIVPEALWDGVGGASVGCSLLMVKSCVPRLSGAQSPPGWVIPCLPFLLSLDWEQHILGQHPCVSTCLLLHKGGEVMLRRTEYGKCGL